MIVSANFLLNSKLQNFNQSLNATPPIRSGLQASIPDNQRAIPNIKSMLDTDDKAGVSISNEKEVVIKFNGTKMIQDFNQVSSLTSEVHSRQRSREFNELQRVGRNELPYGVSFNSKAGCAKDTSQSVIEQQTFRDS